MVTNSACIITTIYNVSDKKRFYFYFCSNLINCGLILIILSLFHSGINCERSWDKIYYLKSVATLPYKKWNVQLLFMHISQINILVYIINFDLVG